jgi:hypothetical protein
MQQKSLNSCPLGELDSVLIAWFKQADASNASTDVKIIRDKAFQTGSRTLGRE